MEDTQRMKARWAGLPEPFQFYRLMLSGDHLHFGYWPGDPPDVSLEEAQNILFLRMCDLLPPPPADILDVGCGLGYSAHLLGKAGYRVMGIAPSPELIGYATERYGSDAVRFEAAGFLDEGPCVFQDRTYDVLWFQESLQYIHPLEDVFRECRKRLRPEGRIVVCDEVASGDAPIDKSLVHPIAALVLAIGDCGFRLRRMERIGACVKPTCREMIRRFDRFRQKLIEEVNQADAAERIDHYRNGWRMQAECYESGRMDYVCLMATSDPLRIRTYRQGDEERILPMFREIFRVDRSLAHWNWKFRDNPFGRLAVAVAEDENGRLAAHFCGYAVPIAAATACSALRPIRRFVSFQGGDTMTNPAFRGAGIGKDSVLARTARCFYTAFCEGKTPFIYGFNTGVIRKLGERFLGYEYLEGVPFHVLDVDHLGTHSGWRARLNRMKGFSVERVDRIAEEYSRFFERVCSVYGILTERGASYLKWRYFDCPDGVHRMYAVRRWGKLLGWGVFRRKEEVLLWVDALFDPETIDELGFFLSEVIRAEARAAAEERGTALTGQSGAVLAGSISRIEAWFSPNPAWWSEALGRVGFVVEQEPHHLFPCVKRFSEEFDLKTLGGMWYYTWGDSDLF